MTMVKNKIMRTKINDYEFVAGEEKTLEELKR
jgi:hypothetical protein